MTIDTEQGFKFRRFRAEELARRVDKMVGEAFDDRGAHAAAKTLGLEVDTVIMVVKERTYRRAEFAARMSGGRR